MKLYRNLGLLLIAVLFISVNCVYAQETALTADTRKKRIS